MQELLKRLQDRHVECAQAVAKKAAADAQAAATVTPDAQNVLQTMIQLNQAKTCSKATNKVALHVEKEKDAAEQEVQRLQQLVQVKRARTHVTTANDHEDCDKKSSDDWDLADYLREATRIQNRHSTPLGSHAEVPTPQEDKPVPLEYSRLGLVGWIAYLVLESGKLCSCCENHRRPHS